MSISKKHVLTTLITSTIAITDLQAATIEQIIVTAQKRQQSAQDVPIAMSVIDGDDVKKLGITSGSDIGNQAPNVQVQRPYGDVQPIFSIRGISMTDFKATQASPIGVYMDEVALGVPFTHGMQMFDLERIEVLRGPQGTLFGKNTTGGAVSISSRKPSQEQEGYVTAGYGNFNRIDVQGAYNTTLTDDVAVRVAVNSSKADGHFDSEIPGVSDPDSIDHWAVRTGFSWQVNDSLDVLLQYTHAEQDANAPVISPGGTNIGGFTHTGSAFDSYADRVDSQTVDFDMGALTLNWDLNDELTLTSITGVGEGEYLNKSDADGSPLAIIHIDWGTSFDQVSEDIRLSGTYDRLEFIAGFYYANEEVDGNNFYIFGADRPDAFAGQNINSDLELERESYALYSHVTYDLTENLALNLGLRYSTDEHTLSNFAVRWTDAATGLPSGLAAVVFGDSTTLSLDSDSFEDKEWSGKVGLDYHLSDDTLLYASFSRGYRSGAFNTGALFQNETTNVLDPEFVDAYEIGFKTQYWDNKAQFNSAAFYYDYEDQQFINVVGLSQLLTSAKKASVAGIEAELLLLPTDNLTLNIGVGLLDTEYDDATLLVALDAFGATSRPENLSGNKLVAAPEVNFNFAADYVIPFDSGEVTLHADTVYTSEQYYSAFNDFYDPATVGADYRDIQQDSYWMTNARLTYTHFNSGIEAALWVKNVADEEVKGYAINSQTYGGFDYTQYMKPRTYGVEVTYRF